MFNRKTINGIEGLLVPPRGEGALVQAITSLISDSTLRQHMGASGRAKAEEYRWERVAQIVMDYYLELPDSSPARGCN